MAQDLEHLADTIELSDEGGSTNTARWTWRSLSTARKGYCVCEKDHQPLAVVSSSNEGTRIEQGKHASLVSSLSPFSLTRKYRSSETHGKT